MQDEPCHDDLPDLRDDNVNELIVTAHRRTLDAIKQAIAGGVPGATAGTTVCRDWHRSLHVTYTAAGGRGLHVAHLFARRWRQARFALAFDFRVEGRGGYARWEDGTRTAIEDDDSSYQGDGPYGDYITVTHPRGGPECAMTTPRRLADLCFVARRFGWRPDEPLLRALDATLDPIDARRLEANPEMDDVVATLPAEEALRLAAALGLARGCVGVPVEILDGLGIRGDAPPGGAYGTGRAIEPEKATLRTLREVHGVACAGVELVVMRTILARPPKD